VSEELTMDEQSQSHYEISLTAGQAFVAFVLLLLSLAASFAFGLMIGKGQADDRLVVRKEPAVINEASTIPAHKNDGKIVELGVAGDDFKAPETKTDSAAAAAPNATIEATPATASEPPNTEMPASMTPAAAPPPPAAATPAPVTPAPTVVAAPAGPVYAQLLSTGDQKTAENLAAKLIDKGFNLAYVERGTNDKGPIFRVRVKFNSEADAKAAEPRLKEFAKEVWITR
jgi:cell division septation protein DedD